MMVIVMDAVGNRYILLQLLHSVPPLPLFISGHNNIFHPLPWQLYLIPNRINKLWISEHDALPLALIISARI